MDQSQEEESIDELREALQELIACVETTTEAHEIGSDTWAAVHHARMALERTS